MPDYDFRSLSPTDFEALACDLLNEELGLRLRSYPAGPDQGIDLRQVGPDGSTTIGQCKHYPRTDRAKFLSAVRAEARKPAREQADRYLFVTSFELTARLEKEVAEILGIPVHDVWGPQVLNDALGRHDRIERRHFKLWLSSTLVLDRMKHAGQWHRSEVLLEDITEQGRYWVETPAYTQVQEFLRDHGLSIITGAPGVGKTFLANMITLNAANDGWEIIDLGRRADPAEVWRQDKRQFFYHDDFLGQAELEPDARELAPDLLRFIASVRRNRDSKRLVMTTRAQVLRQAEQAKSERLRELADDPARFVLSLNEYDEPTRREILANHLYFCGLSEGEHKAAIADRRLVKIVRHPSYYPRLIEEATCRLVGELTAEQILTQLLETLDHPDKLWRVSFDALSPTAREIVLTLATLGVRPVSLAEIHDLVGEKDPWIWDRALRSLEPTWIRIVDNDYERSANLASPGCRDHVLGRLDNIEFAEDRVRRMRQGDRSRRVEQMLALGQAAGLINSGLGGHTAARRPKLRKVLENQQDLLAELVETRREGWDLFGLVPAEQLRALRDTAMVLTAFGSSTNTGWFLERVRELIGDSDFRLPPAGALTLAAWLSRLPAADLAARDGLVEDLIRAALAQARTPRDLDAYEDLPVELHRTGVHREARERAAQIIDAEHERLLAEVLDPEGLADLAGELHHRAEWYGHELHLGQLCDRIDDLREAAREA